MTKDEAIQILREEKTGNQTHDADDVNKAYETAFEALDLQKELVEKVVEILPELVEKIIEMLPNIVNGLIKCSECDFYANHKDEREGEAK